MIKTDSGRLDSLRNQFLSLSRAPFPARSEKGLTRGANFAFGFLRLRGE